MPVVSLPKEERGSSQLHGKELESIIMRFSFGSFLTGTVVVLGGGVLSLSAIPSYAQQTQDKERDCSSTVNAHTYQSSSETQGCQASQDSASAISEPMIQPVAVMPRVPEASPFAGLEATESSRPKAGSQADSSEFSEESENMHDLALQPIIVNGAQVTGYPNDWTHHRVIFTNPGTEQESIERGRHQEWLRVVNDPRYILSALKRQMTAQGPASEAVAAREAERARVTAALNTAAARQGDDKSEAAGVRTGFMSPVGPARPIAPVRARHPFSSAQKEDWNLPLTTGNAGQLTGATMEPNVYPAKYTFNPNGTMDCPNDYIVYPTGLPGTTTTLGLTPGTPNIIAYNNLDTGILSGVTSCGTLLAGVFDLNLLLNQNASPNPTVMWAYNTGGAVTSSPVLSLDGSQVAYIQQTGTLSKAAQLVVLKWSSPGNSAGITLNVGGLLTLGATTMINGNEVSYGVANIPLLGNLFSNYPVANSPTPLLCGSGLGGYQSAIAGESTSGTAGPAYTCTINLANPGLAAGGATVSQSSPFPDYINGALYVGDDQGYLHMFTGLSFGQPGTKAGQAGSTATIAEATPLKLGNYPLGAPAYDNVSGCIFIGDSSGVLYKVNPGFSNGTVCTGTTAKLTLAGKTAQLANGTTNGILDAPMVDSNNQAVYAFVSSNTAGKNAIYQFSPAFTTGTNALPTTVQTIGTGGSALELLDGDFDNVYYSSSVGSGNMYVVGNTHVAGTTNAGGTLYKVPIVTGNLQMPVALATVNALSANYAYASPVMEFCNNGGSACSANSTKTTAGIDLIYFSTYKGTGGLISGLVSQLLSNTACDLGSVTLPGGCIYGINVSTPTAPTLFSDYYTSWAGAATNPCWATSGFVIDNGDTTLLGLNIVGAGSQMYFVGMNGNSDSLLTGGYDPCNGTKSTGNIINAQQIGQGQLFL